MVTDEYGSILMIAQICPLYDTLVKSSEIL